MNSFTATRAGLWPGGRLGGAAGHPCAGHPAGRGLAVGGAHGTLSVRRAPTHEGVRCGAGVGGPGGAGTGSGGARGGGRLVGLFRSGGARLVATGLATYFLSQMYHTAPSSAARASAGDDAPVDSSSTAAPEEGTPADGAAATASSAASATTTGEANSRAQFRLVSGASSMPHPAKVDKGGEDSHFIGADHRSIGVADGVGGWAELGIDPGLYAKQLMRYASEAARITEPNSDAPGTILQSAYYRTSVQGSSTACICVLEADVLHAANLGDSGFLIVRNGRVAFSSPPQQHDFNFPFQLGSMDAMGDSPVDAEKFSVPVQAGDVIVAATDGLFDNVYNEDCAKIVNMGKAKSLGPEQTATALARYARMKATDSSYLSPFAQGAQSAGFQYLGGKLDDITVVVSYVIQEAKL